MKKTNTKENTKNGEKAGVAAGAAKNAELYADNVVLNGRQGHGFAAEKANHLYDKISGKDAAIIGGDNAKNGADRLVDNELIQTKYCQSGSKCISECFEGGTLRYTNPDGTPMLIEVPSDKYPEAIKSMESRIRAGEVPGVSDPLEAREIVRKGAVTYQQAINIAKAGTIDGLTYDAIKGVELSLSPAGLSFALSFAANVWNGKGWEEAVSSAGYAALKVGGTTLASSIIVSQLGRTGLERGMRSGTDLVVNKIGSNISSWLVNGVKSGNNIYGAAAKNYLSKALRGNLITGAVTSIVLSVPDFKNFFEGKMSGAQCLKNLTVTSAGVAGGVTAGTAALSGGVAMAKALSITGAAGAAVGMVVGTAGAMIGGALATKAATSILDQFIEDDDKKMFIILEKEFSNLSFQYFLSEKEAEEAIELLQKNNLPELLKNTFSADDKVAFLKGELTPIVESVTNGREVITVLPTPEETSLKMVELIREFMAAQFVEKAPELFLHAPRESPLGKSFKHVSQFDEDFRYSIQEEKGAQNALFSYDGSWMFGNKKNWIITSKGISYPGKKTYIKLTDIKDVYTSWGNLVVETIDGDKIKLPSKFLNNKSIARFINNTFNNTPFKESNFKLSLRSAIKEALKITFGAVLISTVIGFIFPSALLITVGILAVIVVLSPMKFMDENKNYNPDKFGNA